MFGIVQVNTGNQVRVHSDFLFKISEKLEDWTFIRLKTKLLRIDSMLQDVIKVFEKGSLENDGYLWQQTGWMVVFK